MRRRATISALLLVGVGVVLGTTVFRADIAQATGLAQSVTIDNTSTNPVPVREQNLDGSNIRVHEEGTAEVHVTNSSLSVTAEPPITGGAGAWAGLVQIDVPPAYLLGIETASALSIHLSDEIVAFSLLNGNRSVASFYGPREGGNSSINLALTRPVSFDHILCNGLPGGKCSVGWVGTQP
jgi:hypothetical protein